VAPGPEAASPAARPTVALLIFSRNDLPSAWTVVRSLTEVVDEVVVVDSSDPDRFAEGMARPPAPAGVRVLRVVPTGSADLLHPYGVAHVRSDWTLRVDTDEEVSDELRRRLGTLGDSDGYLVPRWEVGLRAYTWHVRLFRTHAYVPAVPAFANPTVRGTLRPLARRERLVHHADFRQYGAGGDRWTRYADVESYERPFSRSYARSTLSPFDRGVGPWERTDRPLSPPAARFVLGVEAVRSWLTTGSWRFASFVWRYGLGRISYAERLGGDERSVRLAVTAEIRAAGGMVRYLGFDDAAYVDRLTADWAWSSDGPELLEELLRYRHAHGRPRPTVQGP
jgi:hypothetical protein